MTEIEDYWEANRLVGHYFPLRPGCDAYLALPRNLTAGEAERLVNVINAIAFDDDRVTAPVGVPSSTGEKDRYVGGQT